MNNQESQKQSNMFPWIILAMIAFFAIGSCSLTTYFSLDKTFRFIEGFDSKAFKIKSKDNVIAQLNVEGVIMGGREEFFDALEEIEEGVKDKKIKGLLVYINSPGGSVAPTQDIYRRILEIKKQIPVVCSMGDVAASGGYYLATACDTIYALPGTTTGSIGVIFQIFNFENLANWAKIKPITIKAGKMKDVGSPFRAMTPEERTYLEDLLHNVHEQFINDVAKGRGNKISMEDLRKIADGRIFTGEQAIKLGLVDLAGGPNDALKSLRVGKKLGDLEVLKLPKPKRNWSLLTSKMEPLDMVLDQMHPFQGMLPMLLPPYYELSVKMDR